MKYLFTFWMLLVGLAANAQEIKYNSTVDEIWGGRCWQELDGKYYATSESKKAGTWPSDDNVVVVYGLHVPEGHVRCDAVFTPKAGKRVTLCLRVVLGETGEVVCEHEAVATSTAAREQTLELMPDIVFPKDAWYRFELTSPKGNTTIGSFTKLRFQRESSLCVTDPGTFMAPSVHLNTWGTSNADAPKGDSYDWIYQEVMMPRENEHPNTYAMSIGGTGFYSGIQASLDGKGDYFHSIIFSVWDNGDTDKDANLPAYLRSGILDSDPEAVTTRFGGEGTGASARFTNGYYWTPDHWVQMLINTRPEEVPVTITDASGQEKTILYQNTLMTCWYKNLEDPAWRYLATIRSSGRNMQLGGFYSFVENWTGTGGELLRRAYFRNSSMRSAASGKWYSRNSVSYGHTQGGPERDSRCDYGHGKTDLYDNCFYLQTGGFTGLRDSSSMVPLVPTGQMPWVDSINIERLNARVDQAIRKERQSQMQSELKACRTVNHSAWKILSYSDEETTGEKETGRCADALDGNDNTYWHSQWKNGQKAYPHYVILQADEEATINALTLYQERDESYRVKTLRVSTSEDGKTWTAATDKLSVPSANNVEVDLGKSITSQYFKLEFLTGYGTNMAINEIRFLRDYDEASIRKLAQDIVALENRFGGYSAADLRPLKELLSADADAAPALLLQALDELGRQGTPLKYGVVGRLDNLASQRAYVLATSSKKTLCAQPSDDAPTAAYVSEKDVDVLNPDNNWMVLRSERYADHYIYNIGQQKFLDMTGAEPRLTDTPTATTLKANAGGFLLERSKYTFLLQDNYALRPTAELTDSLLQQAENTVHQSEALDRLCSEALEVLGLAFTYDATTNALGKTASRWSSNCNSTQNSANDFAKMLDNKPSTYYQSWYSGIQWPAATPYIQLRLTSAERAFYFTFTPSQDSKYGATDIPSSITLFVSADGKLWNQLTTLADDLPTTIDQSYTSPIFVLGGDFKYIRFQVNGTVGSRDSGRVFAFSEFQVYRASLDETASPYHRWTDVQPPVDALSEQLAQARQHIADGTVTPADFTLLQQAILAARAALEEAIRTGIPDILPSSPHASVLPHFFFDLSGRPIPHPTRGLYIHNGQKVIIK